MAKFAASSLAVVAEATAEVLRCAILDEELIDRFREKTDRHPAATCRDVLRQPGDDPNQPHPKPRSEPLVRRARDGSSGRRARAAPTITTCVDPQHEADVMPGAALPPPVRAKSPLRAPPG